LTLFKPWHTGHDLRQNSELWNEAFTAYNFGTWPTQLMHNMNIHYECLDAQDDFHAQMKKGTMSLPSWLADEAALKDLDQTVINDYTEDDCTHNLAEDIEISAEIGKKTKARNSLMNAINRVLTVTGWTECNAKLLPDSVNLKPVAPATVQLASQWKAAVVSKHAQVLKQRGQHLHAINPADNNTKPGSFVPNEVKIITKSHLTQTFESSKWGPTINAVLKEYDLNEEQERAFQIVANHSCSESPDQLKMNMSGMAGTGKTRVLEALIELFRQKKESHRLVVVAPTGSAAALLGGSTYHSMFGINSEGEKTSATQLAQVKIRLQGVDYVFLDEVSMTCI
jgi:PIF1-like helicase